MGQWWRRPISGAAAFAAALLPVAPVSSASPGSLAAASRGSLTISLTIRAPERASGLADFAFDGTGAGARTLCLSGAARSYTVAAQGSGPGGALTLSNGEASLAYQAEWLSPSAAGAVAGLSGGSPVTVEAVADCTQAPGAGQLRIALAAADVARLQDSAPYTGTLTLTLAPE